MQNENPKPKPNNDERTSQEYLPLSTFLEAVATTFRMELTKETQRIYLAALMDVPLALLKKAVLEGLKTWRFFPSIAEIFEAVNRVGVNPEAHARAYQELQARYTKACLEDRVPQSLPSIQDTRGEEELKRHVEEWKFKKQHLTAEEFDTRIRELDRQKMELLAGQKAEGEKPS